MATCPSCHAELPHGSRFCPACGTPLGADPSLTRTTPAEEQLPVRIIAGPVPTPAIRARFASDADGLPPGTVLAGRYRVVSLIGQGGMGEVYRADDLTLGQLVALKFLPRRLDQQSDRFTRFLAEVRTARLVSHPNVCRVYDIVQSEGRTFLAMEYVDGEDLSSLLRRIGRLPSDKAIEIARQLCAGLAAAHDRGVLHRDLKPANVMLDSRGRARLTDFGLAGAEEVEIGFAGTPAYMAPEQLRGEPASVQSEVFALGLVLYELFTGRRLFDAPSIAELRDLHDRTDISALSTGVAGIDPAVERVIRRCLDRDPSRRPASALAVAAALPGGDPLAAALAAGETPAPALVAAAGGEGSLRPIVAVALLTAIVLLLPTVALLQSKAKHYGFAPSDPPDAMAARARDVLRRAGYTDTPADSGRGFLVDRDAVSWIASRGQGPLASAEMAGGRPSLIDFWYRDSPATLEPSGSISGEGGAMVSPNDPPMTTEGMSRVYLDARGQLLELTVVPSGVETAAPAPGPTTPDWTPLFAAAGLDPSTFAPAPPQWLPPFAFDARQSWSGPAPERPDVTLRVEAASYRGRAIWFSVVGPWSRPDREVTPPATAGERAANIVTAVIFAGVIAACVALARRNLRLGRGDRTGAWRLAIYLLVVRLLVWLLGGTHVPTIDELGLFIAAAGSALFFAALVGTTYLALEPMVRRQWPQVMIGWSRVLSGQITDPLVGRDVLIGVVATLVVSLLNGVTSWAFPAPPVTHIALAGLSSPRAAVASILNGHTGGIYLSLATCLVYAAGYGVMRRHWLAGGVIVGIVLTVVFLQSGLSASFFNVLFIIVLLLIVLTRFGLLSLMAAWFTGVTLSNAPMTTDFTQWYASTGLIAVGVVLALAIWAFRTSLGGQPVFKET